MAKRKEQFRKQREATKKTPSIWDTNCPLLEEYGIHWLDNAGHHRGADNLCATECPFDECIVGTNRMIKSNLKRK